MTGDNKVQDLYPKQPDWLPVADRGFRVVPPEHQLIEEGLGSDQVSGIFAVLDAKALLATPEGIRALLRARRKQKQQIN
jgi:hypothetical protein